MTFFRVNIPWGVRSFMPWAVTMHGPCSVNVLLGEKFLVSQLHSPGSSTTRPAEREGEIVSWDIQVLALFSRRSDNVSVFSSFFSYQGKLRVVLGQL